MIRGTVFLTIFRVIDFFPINLIVEGVTWFSGLHHCLATPRVSDSNPAQGIFGVFIFCLLKLLGVEK